MTTTLNILREITTGYTIFEKDQVLTEKQLNSVTDYLNDQTRLTRVNLLGVGVASGLRVTRQGDTIRLTKGIGITTDGDLLYYTSDMVFDRFIEYDKSYPSYAPFYINGNIEGDMLPVYELIPQGIDDQRTTFLLSQFNAQTAKNLDDMVAVLLMESYENDPDLCTGTGCDNLGKNCLNTAKLMLIETASIDLLLKPAIATPDEAYSQLNPIVADRPSLPSTLASLTDLTQIYRTTCTKIHTKLQTELAKVYPNCITFLIDIFSSDPIGDWNTRLTALQTTFNTDTKIQYYYDFLKDVVETYNSFRELLFGDTTWCCPDVTWFPKHLLLGNLIPGTDLDEHRTTFYPSPIVSQTAEALDHARFLIQKLDTLIKTFHVPAASETTSIRITPSFFEDHPLESRAIPYYYPVTTTQSIHQTWNYHLHQRGMDPFNYSYHASAYGAQGGAANPLDVQIGSFSFFRVEGHLGHKLGTASNTVSGLIQSRNLPFSVLTATLADLSQSGDINFTDLIAQHPELEHFGGVIRGGTLVLLADTNDTVVADFMLPYLPRQHSGGSICSLLVSPSDSVGRILGSIADGQDAHICFQAGTYTLSSRVLLQNKGHLTITGSGKGTRIIAPGLESVLEFNTCKSVSISNCHLENAVARTDIPSGFASNTEDLRGVLTFINCPTVELEKVSVRCAHQVVRSASCITVRQDLSVLNTQVRIRHCDLLVGYQQIGMLLINVERSHLSDNQIQVDRSNLATTLTALASMRDYRLRLLPRLIANAYLGNEKPQGTGATSTRFDECNVTVSFANQFVRFKTETSLIGQWQTLVNARNPFVQSRRDLSNFIKQLARDILLSDTLRATLPAFNAWYQMINKQSSVIASQGIVVAGSRAQEVRILNNTVQGFLQGIHIGISPRITSRAGSVLISGNRIEVSAPVDQIRERHGIYISSCDSLMIQNNYLQAIAASLPIEGIRVSGRLGRMALIRHNHLVGFNPNGIYFNPMDNYGSEKMQWLVADNIASSAKSFIKVVSNLPGTTGSQIVAKVQNSNNFQ